MNSCLDVKENDEHALDFAFHMSYRVRLSAYGSCFGPRNACLINARVAVLFFPRFAQHLPLFLCRIHREISAYFQP
jgi:hypothetical protein